MLTAAPAALAVLLLAAGGRGLARAASARRTRHRLGAPSASGAPPAALVTALDDADVGVRPEHAWLGWIGLGVLAALLGLATGGPAAAVVLAVPAAAGPAVALRLLAGRADRRLERELPAALELVARSLRAGSSLRDALAGAAASTPGRLGDDIGAVVGTAAAGLPLAAALDEWAGRRPCAGVRLAVAALALGAESGGATARAVDGVAATLRAGEAVAAEARALSSQARLSAMVIALAPVVFTVLAAGADPRTTQFLLRTPVGLGCLAAGLALDAAAAVWMHRLTAVTP